jgi:hypothetical protein
LIRVKPHWSAPLAAAVLGAVFAGIFIWRSYADHWQGGQTYWFIAALLAWLGVCGYFAFFHVLEISHDTLVLHRYLGFGDRRIAISRVLEVVLVPASNWLRMPIPSVRVVWDGGRVNLHSSAYEASDLGVLVDRLADGGVRVDPAVREWLDPRRAMRTAGPPRRNR